jgi:exodeoxyribonuclease VII small subunit
LIVTEVEGVGAVAKKKDPEKLTFEQAFTELEALVETLESGDLPLDKSMDTFARGQALAKRCAQLLEEAELKLSELSQDENGEFSESDLDYELEE